MPFLILQFKIVREVIMCLGKCFVSVPLIQSLSEKDRGFYCLLRNIFLWRKEQSVWNTLWNSCFSKVENISGAPTLNYFQIYLGTQNCVKNGNKKQRDVFFNYSTCLFSYTEFDLLHVTAGVKDGDDATSVFLSIHKSVPEHKNIYQDFYTYIITLCSSAFTTGSHHLHF